MIKKEIIGGKKRTIIREEKESIPKKGKREKKNGRKKYLKLALSYRKKRLENRTKAELAFQDILDELKIKYEPEKLFFTRQGFKFVDFFLKDYQAGIEIDGGYHFKAEQLLKDEIRAALLKQKAKIFKMIRFSNDEVLNNSTEKIKVKLLTCLCPAIMEVFGETILEMLTGCKSQTQYGMY